MLTGRETLAATFAVTAHRHRTATAVVDGPEETTTWGELAVHVRRASLGWTVDGPRSGQEVVLDPTTDLAEQAVTLLVAAAVGATAVVAAAGPSGDPARLDLRALAVTGADLDDRHPDRYEVLVAERSGQEPLLRCGDVVHTHASLLVAARSLAQLLGTAQTDRLSVELPRGSVSAVVAGLVLPFSTGASSQRGHPAGAAVVDAALATTVLVQAGAAVPTRARSRRLPRPARRREPIVLSVLDARGGSPSRGDLAAAQALSVDAAGGVVTGFGAPGSLGRPLPGTSVAIDDEGEVHVRSAAVPTQAPGRRDDGWLPTGLRGELVEGSLVLGSHPEPAPAAGAA